MPNTVAFDQMDIFRVRVDEVRVDTVVNYHVGDVSGFN